MLVLLNKFHENFIGMKDVWLKSDEYMYSDVEI
jgi:hypothetical protein